MLIAQLSDPHVRPDGCLYQGVVDSNAMFAAAVAHVMALDPPPDLVLLTGDLVDEGTAAEYAMIKRLLDGLRIPILMIPGNHDDRAALRDAFQQDHPYMPAAGPLNFVVSDRGPVRVVGLDVTIPGAHHGQVDEAALVWLAETLAAEPMRPTLIMMHHPPVAIGVPYLDAYMCRSPGRLEDVIRRFDHVERVTCGHVHRSFVSRWAGTVLCACPSTVTQIALRLRPDAEPASYLEPPACLLHHWRPGIGMITHVSPIGRFEGPFPFT